VITELGSDGTMGRDSDDTNEVDSDETKGQGSDWTRGRARRATSVGQSGNEIMLRADGGSGGVLGGGVAGDGVGRCLTEEEAPEVKYFYLNQNPEAVKILTSDNPTQR
jgi:hypothetical protein